MPLNRCESDGKPGWKWGDVGACYVFTAGDDVSEAAAKKKALGQAAAMGEFPGTGNRDQDDAAKAPIELRSASVGVVKFPQRIIEVVAMPYNQEALVEYRGRLWEESFAPASFEGIEKRPNRVRTNRDHDKIRTFGKVVRWRDSSTELVGEVRAAQTPLGDESLALADEGILSASVGFAVRGRDQELNFPKRRIVRAYIDHLALTTDPAYQGAETVSVRDSGPDLYVADLPPMPATPLLDELRAWRQAHLKRS